MDLDKQISYLAQQLNTKLHGAIGNAAPTPAPTAHTGAGTYNARLVEAVNTQLHGQPNPAPTGLRPSRDEARVNGMTRALMDVARERQDEADLDDEIARFDRDCDRDERKQRLDQASAPLAALARSKPAPRNTSAGKFWQFKMTASNEAELLLYGEISSERSWLDDEDSSGVYADEFVQDLKDLGDVSQITCRINSIGGDIFAAIAIYTQLKTHAARVVGIVDGLAASAATLVLMAADDIQMPIGAMQMIHDPLACLFGCYTADELAKSADTLNTIKESIVAIYADRTGTRPAKIEEMMSEETWMGTDKAVKLGFCDTTLPATVQAEMKGQTLFINGLEHDLSKFKNTPKLHRRAN